MSVRAIGFDLDYTLAVPVRGRDELLTEALDRVGAPDIDREEYLRAHREHMTSDTREPIFAAVLDRYETSVPPAVVAETYREIVNDALVPIDGAMELITTLKAEYRVGLLTNGPTIAQREKLAVLGWDDVFDAVVIAGEVATGKPSVSAFDELTRALDVSESELVFVGDEIRSDIEGAVEAGIRVIQVCYAGGPPRDPRATGHLDRADLRDELPGLIASLSKTGPKEGSR